MRSLMFLLALVTAGVAQAADAPLFTFDGTEFRSVEYSGARVEIGDTISLDELGRRFSSFEVSKRYGFDREAVGEYFEYIIGRDDVEVALRTQDDQILGWKTDTRGAAGPLGAQVGDRVSSALGDEAYCDFGQEDGAAFCKSTEDAALTYAVKRDGGCGVEDRLKGRMPVPPCLTIIAISFVYRGPPRYAPEFSFDGKVFKSVKHPEQYLEMGETISFVELGRRFASYDVTAEYYVDGDYMEERVRYTIAAGPIEFYMLMEDDVVYDGTTFTRGIAGDNGVQVGDSLPLALGESAYCHLEMADSWAFCKRTEEAPLAYFISEGADCVAVRTEGKLMLTPVCEIHALSQRW